MAGLLNATQLDPNKVSGYDPLKVESGKATTASAAAVNAVGTGYTAAAPTISPESSAAWQVAKNSAADSPLVTQATTFADKQSNRRGLLNSSMAVGAAYDSVIKNVMPMSQQDANTRATADAAYKASVDRASEFTAGAGNTASLNNSQQGTNVSVSNARALDETDKFNTGLDAQTSQVNTASGNQALRDTSGALNTQSLQGGQIASQEKMQGNQLASSERIQGNQLASAERVAQLQATVQQGIAKLNAGTQTKLAQLQANTTLTDTDKKLAASKIMASQENAFKLEIQKIQSDTTLTAEERRNATTTAIANGDQNTKLLLDTADNAAKLGLAQLNVDAQVKIAGIDNGAKTELAKLTMANDVLVKSNSSAAGLMQQAMVGLSQISVSTMDAGGKQSATNNILTTLQNSLDAVKDVDSLRLSQYFEVAPPVAGSTVTDSEVAANGLLNTQRMPGFDIGNINNTY